MIAHPPLPGLPPYTLKALLPLFLAIIPGMLRKAPSEAHFAEEEIKIGKVKIRTAVFTHLWEPISNHHAGHPASSPPGRTNFGTRARDH
jgi:hypothetical protein